jgi:hypothetical protein
MGFFLLDGNDERRGEAQRQANPTAPWRERMRLQSQAPMIRQIRLRDRNLRATPEQGKFAPRQISGN